MVGCQSGMWGNPRGQRLEVSRGGDVTLAGNDLKLRQLLESLQIERLKDT
jgi:hypothetical protein